MSVAYFIVLERDIEGFDPFVNGKALAHANEKALEKLCAKLNVAPLAAFLSQDPEMLDDFLEEEDVDVPDDLPDADWFDAAEGLATVRALIEHLTAEPGSLKNSAEIVADLKEYEEVFMRLEKEGVRWHLELDF